MKELLVHMRDKLNNINKRNRSIRLLKVHQKWSFDLAEIDRLDSSQTSDSIIRKIVDNKTKGKLTLVHPTLDDDNSMVMAKKLTDLYRQMKSIEDETGLNDLYLGFPFLSGTLQDGTFIQAPLFLYPLRLEKDNKQTQKWVLSLEEGDPQLNRTLILALRKLSQLSFSDDIFEEGSSLATKYDFSQWVSFLQKHYINVEFTSKGLHNIKQYNSSEVPEIANLTLLENAIIGSFPQGGSSNLVFNVKIGIKRKDNISQKNFN